MAITLHYRPIMRALDFIGCANFRHKNGKTGLNYMPLIEPRKFLFFRFSLVSRKTYFPIILLNLLKYWCSF